MAALTNPGTDAFDRLFQFVRSLRGLRTHDEVALALVEAARLEPGMTALLVERTSPEGELTVVAARGPDASALNGYQFRSDVSLAGLALRTAVVLVSPDLDRDLRVGISHRTGLKARSAVCVPVCVGEAALGVLMVLFPVVGDVEQPVMTVLRGLVEAAAPSIERSRLQREADRLARHVSALQEVSHMLTMADSALALTLLVEVLTGILGLDCCCLLVPGTGDRFQVAAAAGRRANAVRQLVLDRPILKSEEALQGVGIERVLAVPVHTRSGPGGFLLVSRESDGSSPQEESLLAVWAAILGVALDQADHRPAPTSQPAPRIPQVLTEREVEILHMVARGMKNGEIAAELGLSPATVKTHVSRVLRKLRIPDRTKAAVYVLQGGFPAAPSAS